MRSRIVLWVLGALVAVCAVAGEASAQYFGQNKIQYEMYNWRSIASDHFEVYFYDGSDSLAMRTLDLAEKTNAVFSKRLAHQLSRKIPIVLYGSHNDFSQTNTISDLIDGGTGGFTEPLRDRVVVPFTGSYEDFRHVLVHELTHAFQFDILYNGTGISLLSGQGYFQVPLWFAEGMAEYFSLGMESNAEMWCRDGALAGYIPPLEYQSGYPVYKFGQSAIAFLIDRYGEERFRDVLKRARQMRGFERAFERTYGMTVAKFDEKWREDLRKRYWPTVAKQELPEAYARRLTDHRKDQSTINISPAVSPQGDRVAYYSDRREYSDIYVMSAFDGRVLHRVIRGEQDRQFESMPLFRSALTWSPDGQSLAFTAKSRGRDRLYVVAAKTGKVQRSFALPCDAAEYPAWSPVGDSIVVAGVKGGRSDLYLVNAANGVVTRLTNDAWDEKEPAWSPDGRRITFSSDRGAPVVLHAELGVRGYGHYGIWELDVATGATTELLDTAGEDHCPAWSPDGRKLAFVSDRDGAPNLYLFDPANQSVTRLTDVLGGIQSVSWARHEDRLVFSAFDRLGWDIFAVREPLANDSTLASLRRHVPASVVTAEVAAEFPPRDTVRAEPRAALAGAWADSAAVADTAVAERHDRRGSRRGGAHGGDEGRPPVAGMPGQGRPMGGMVAGIVPPDTSAGLPVRAPLHETGGPFALADTVLGQKPARYRWKFGAEEANGGVAAATGYGFAGSTSVLFSDFLGDRSLFVAADLYPGSFSETNALVVYSYLPRRWDWSVGAFHFKNFYQSRTTTLGEQLSSQQVFSERTYGALTQWSYPFDRFRRADLELMQMVVERQFFPVDSTGYYVEGPTEARSVTSPSISLVGDNSLSGAYGPVNGSRYNLTFSSAIPVFSKALVYRTLSFDWRKYWDLTSGYTFALRSLDAGSWGREPQAFRLGGYSTVRGYPDFDIVGSHIAMASAELRFPFIRQMGLVGPIPLGNLNLRGALFSDAGFAWNEGDVLRFSEFRADGRRHLDSPYLSFGTGIRTYFLLGLVKLDVAWHTDLVSVSRPRWHFSIGPEF